MSGQRLAPHGADGARDTETQDRAAERRTRPRSRRKAPSEIAASIKRAEEAQQQAAAEAAGILREDAPRTPAEQAALAAIDRYRWVPVHAKDWNTAIVRLLSIADLLRDKAHEAEENKFAAGWAELSARERRLDAQHINFLYGLLEQAAGRLDAGDDPGEVAAWIKERRAALVEATDKAKRAAIFADPAPAGVPQ